MKKPQHFFWGIAVFFVLLFSCGVDHAKAQTHAAPEAYLPQTHFEFPAVYKGQKLQHAFPVQNKGSTPLEIIEVKTD